MLWNIYFFRDGKVLAHTEQSAASKVEAFRVAQDWGSCMKYDKIEVYPVKPAPEYRV